MYPIGWHMSKGKRRLSKNWMRSEEEIPCEIDWADKQMKPFAQVYVLQEARPSQIEYTQINVYQSAIKSGL